MSDKLTIKIKPSKIYLILTISTYLLALFSVWYYFYNFWISLVMSIVLSLWLYYFLFKIVLLARHDSITQITLSQNYLIIQKKDQSTQQYSKFYPAYQSRFLLIINFEKECIVVFKDSLKEESLSKLNNFLNAHT